MLISPPIRTLVSPGRRVGWADGSGVTDDVPDGTGVGDATGEVPGETGALADADVPGEAVPVKCAVQPAFSPQTRTVRRYVSSTGIRIDVTVVA